jgi:glucose/mannose-6-phosphate isomerase
LTDLDDPAALRAADPGGMLDAVLALPDHCRPAYELGRSAPALPGPDGVAAIAFCGMGGSAVAGDVIAALAAATSPVPVSVVRSPELPAHCGPRTLTIVSSYSGDTAETLSAFEDAARRGGPVIAVTSGGALAARADELGAPCLRVPGGFAMPRAAFAFLSLAPLGALEAMGLLPGVADEVDEAASRLRELVRACGPDSGTGSNPAKALARGLRDRVPVIWGADGVAAVAASRWKTQLNENAKVPAFWSALPELDHNEVVGWAEGRGRGFAVVALRHDGEHPEVAARFPPSTAIAAASGAEVHEVWARARSPLARLLELVMHGDLVATYLGIARGVDPTPIEAINRLKRSLAGAG